MIERMGGTAGWKGGLRSMDTLWDKVGAVHATREHCTLGWAHSPLLPFLLHDSVKSFGAKKLIGDSISYSNDRCISMHVCITCERYYAHYLCALDRIYAYLYVIN